MSLLERALRVARRGYTPPEDYEPHAINWHGRNRGAADRFPVTIHVSPCYQTAFDESGFQVLDYGADITIQNDNTGRSLLVSMGRNELADLRRRIDEAIVFVDSCYAKDCDRHNSNGSSS